MSRRQLTSTLVVGVLVVVGVVAAVDAARSRDSVGRSAGGRTETEQPDSATSLAGTLKAEGIGGVLYYSDLEADCRVQALHLPALETTSPPMLRACRFELPPDPGTGALDRGTAWQPGGQAAATCAEGWVEVSTRAGEAIGKTKGCAPAWKPDRTLTVIRDGEVWGTPCPGPEGYARPACWRELLSTAELKRAAHAVPFVPTGPRHLRSVMAIRVAWFNETRAAVLVRVRLRGRLRVLGPVAVLAVYEGTRLVRATQYAGAFDLRMSPQRSFIGIVETGRRVTIVSPRGTQVLRSADLPSPSAHAVAWSPDERWVAVGSRWSVYLLRMADLAADRQPRIIRLPLAAGDLAWR